jgi:hypothetical protein
MRPFVWGAMLLLTVAAFALCPAVLYQSRGTAEAVAAESSSAGKVWVMTTPARGKPASSQTIRKLRQASGEDLQLVLYTWDTKGKFRFTKEDAWESALENAQCEVTHLLGLTAPPPREVIKEKLVKAWDEDPKLIDGQELVCLNLHLALTRGTFIELSEADRAARVTHRMEGAARGLGILVAALAAVAGYIRLDELTKGYYTGRLRALAVLLVAVAAWAIARA